MDTEVERLIVRLIGDGSSYQTMMRTAAASTQQAAQMVAAATSRMEAMRGTINGLGRSFVSALGAFGLVQSLRGAFDQFANMERGQIRLRAVLEGTGQDVDALMTRYEAFSAMVTKTTLVTKGQTFAMIQQASMMGLVGQAAEDAVKIAISLGSLTGRDPEGMMRVASNIQRGNFEMARRVLGLQGVKGDALSDAVMKRLQAGMAAASAEFDSAYGRVERLGRAFKSMGLEIGGVVAKFFLPLVSIMQQAFDQFKKLDQGTKDIVTGLLIFVMLDTVLGQVWNIIKSLLGPILALTVFVVKNTIAVIVNTVAWVTWKTLLAASLLVVMTLAAAMAVFNALISVSSVLAFGGAIAVVVVIFLAVYTIVKAVIGAINGLIEGFRNIATMVTPFRAITAVFGEWWTMLKRVFEVAQSDLPLAWRMLQAGFTLAISQLKDVFPPLWDYLVEGFGHVWTMIAENFKLEMAKSMILGSSQAAQNARRHLDEAADLRNRVSSRALQELRIRPSAESAETRAARAVYQALIPSSETLDQAHRLGIDLGAQINKGLGMETSKMDAVIFGSLGALQRIEEYKQRLQFTGVSDARDVAMQNRANRENPTRAMVATEIAGLIGLGSLAATQGPLAGGFNAAQTSTAGSSARDIVDALHEIRDRLTPTNNSNHVTLVPVNFGRP